MDKVLLSSNRHDWETPPDFFAELDKEFHFTLDPCCEPETAKCAKYYTKETDGLSQSWGGRNGVLQSTLRQTARQVDQEMRGRKPTRKSRYAYSGTN